MRFVAWPSIHLRHVPFFFSVRSFEIAHGLNLSWMKPLSSSSWTCRYISLCFTRLILYAPIFDKEALGNRSIACWTSHVGGNIGGNSSDARSANSCRIAWISGSCDSSFGCMFWFFSTKSKRTSLSWKIKVKCQGVRIRPSSIEALKSCIFIVCETIFWSPNMKE